MHGGGCLLLLLLPLLLLINIAGFLLASTNEAGLQCKINGEENSSYRIITVSKGGGDIEEFNTIQEAVDSIPRNNEHWTKILVKSGVYTEQVEIPSHKECIVLEGESRDTTVITSSAQESDRIDATVVVGASNFIAREITFHNNMGKHSQGLAVAIYGDRCSFHSCGFLGYQDTIFDARGRHYFNSCYIEGAVDFIWGAGQSFYQSCLINSTDPGFITAQGREKSTDTNGFVFSDCRVTGKGPTYLGRAYRPYARVIYETSDFDDVIAPQGWDPRLFLEDEDKFTFAEVNCRGPGADPSHRVEWEKKLENNDLKQYTRENFVDQEGWIADQPN